MQRRAEKCKAMFGCFCKLINLCQLFFKSSTFQPDINVYRITDIYDDRSIFAVQICESLELLKLYFRVKTCVICGADLKEGISGLSELTENILALDFGW